MDIIHNAISWGPQFEEVPFMDLRCNGDPIKVHDGPSDLLCKEFLCCIVYVTSLQQGFHLHLVLGIELGDLLYG